MTEQIEASRNLRGPSKSTLELRASILRIVGDFDPPMTVRQVFYQCSVRGAVGKTEADYDRVQRQVLAMRREGMLSYDAIADQTRWQRKPRTYNSLAECLTNAQENYRASVWGQLNHYVEMWLEKDALAGVLLEETSRFDVPLMCCRGYSSESFAFEAAQGMQQRLDQGDQVYVYYLGDLDPSGWHMGLELESKLKGFVDRPITFQRLGVNEQQIVEMGLPTRETKRTDSRVKAFEARFGYGAPSCELDAMPPDVLRGLVRDAVEAHLPDGWLDQIEVEEDLARQSLARITRVLPVFTRARAN